MTANRLKLVLFDVDGTLVDSQGLIVAAMDAAFDSVGAAPPPRSAVLSIVGLSLEQAMARLAPAAGQADLARMVEVYKDDFSARRHATGAAGMPLYPGAREVLETLSDTPEILLGVATGKSRRGLRALFDAHDLKRFFVTTQVADDHPSKPHPSMVMTALSETGVDAADAVMIGDTQYDMAMARAAGISALGVSWGYHPPASLTGAHAVLDRFEELPGHLNRIWEDAS